MKRQWTAIIALFMAVSITGRAEAVINPDQITVYVPSFKGPGTLGRNVATILQLQLYSTLRRKPWPENPEHHDFGPAMIIWNPEPLDEPSHAAASSVASRLNVLAQMVLWGRAYEYGGGVAVQASITLPRYDDFREQHLEQWRIEYGGASFAVDVPRRRFDASSLILDKEIVKAYSLPTALVIHSQRRGGEARGHVGEKITALQFEPDLAYVRSNGVEGWVRLPNLTATRFELIEMASGIVRVYRGDYGGAVSAFSRVLDNPNTRTPLRIDARLYRGMAQERLGRSGRRDFAAAYALSPFAETTVRYFIMSELAELTRAGSDRMAIGAIRDRLRQFIERNSYLFAPGDPWLESVLDVL